MWRYSFWGCVSVLTLCDLHANKMRLESYVRASGIFGAWSVVRVMFYMPSAHSVLL